MIPLGIRVYGLGAVALGLVGIAWGDFALQWQPVAAVLPGRTALAYVFASLLIAAGATLNWRQSNAPAAAAALAVLYAVVVVFMHGPQALLHAGSYATWNGVAEQTALLAGGIAAYACLTGNSPMARASVKLMALCLLTFGVAHFIYLDFTASMVPAWLPGGQKFWAAFTGVAHLAAGIALLTGVKARLAAILLTAMFASFSALVHLPPLMADTHSHMNWVINAVNLALTGAAWAIVAALQAVPVKQTNTRPGNSGADAAHSTIEPADSRR